MKVAYIDDEKSLRDLYKLVLGRKGIDCITMENAKELKKHKEEDISLIISDGGPNGKIAYDSYKIRDKYMPNTPIFCYTGNPSLVFSLRLEGKEAFNKPMHPDAFITYVEAYRKK